MSANFATQYRIYYEDTDSGGVVYYANYLKFFERARTDFLRSLNISQSLLQKEEGVIFVVSECQIKYRKPAKLDDLVTVNVVVENIGVVSIEMKQQMSLDDMLLAELKVTIVNLDASSFKPKKISDSLLASLRGC